MKVNLDELFNYLKNDNRFELAEIFDDTDEDGRHITLCCKTGGSNFYYSIPFANIYENGDIESIMMGDNFFNDMDIYEPKDFDKDGNLTCECIANYILGHCSQNADELREWASSIDDCINGGVAWGSVAWGK